MKKETSISDFTRIRTLNPFQQTRCFKTFAAVHTIPSKCICQSKTEKY